ncbi:MAG: hypothetical protein C4522_01240 [Desulfobacteraceae bacterium]|nr:MAG: hypothetical protein C4522_01240 [Desulfobacteraceae bacterium]
MFFKSLPIRIKNTLSSPLKERIFFLHIPKCGGNSIKDALRNAYLSLFWWQDNAYVYLSNSIIEKMVQMLIKEDSDAFRVSPDCVLRMTEQLLLYHMSLQKVKCIAGHIPFSEIAFRNFGGQFATFTLLRDPVDRWISEYYYNRNHQRPNAKMPIEEYIMSGFGKAQGTQYVLYIGGRSNGNDHESLAAVQRAKENIEKFAVVGFIDKLDDFVDRFHHRFGIRLEIGRKNVTPLDNGRDSISDSFRRQIENICERDYEVYNCARRKFLLL